MNNSFDINGIEKNNSAEIEEIDLVEKLMRMTFPDIYKELLKKTNGLIVYDGTVIYSTKDLEEMNKVWEVKEYASGYIAIGDNSGGSVYLMRQEKNAKEVFSVDAGVITPDDQTVKTKSFIELINEICNQETNGKNESNICDVIQVNKTNGGLEDLIKIKNMFGIEKKTADILKGSKNLPYTLIENYPIGKAKKLKEKLGEVGSILELRKK